MAAYFAKLLEQAALDDAKCARNKTIKEVLYDYEDGGIAIQQYFLPEDAELMAQDESDFKRPMVNGKPGRSLGKMKVISKSSISV